MARMRSLRPDYFLREDMADVSLEAHFLLAGLQVQADRDGRLLERPRTIKAQVFPFREVDMERALAELVQARAIARYESDGRRIIALLTWEDDQTPHPKETSADLPPPPVQPERMATVADQPSRKVAEPSRQDPLGLGVGIGSRDGSGSGSRPTDFSAVPLRAPPAPPLVLEAQEPEKPKRVPSPTALGEFIDWARAETRPRLAPDAPDNAVMQQHQRVRLGEAVKLHGLEAVKAAFRLWMGWAPAQEKGYPLGFFAAQWEQWVGQVKAPGARTARTADVGRGADGQARECAGCGRETGEGKACGAPAAWIGFYCGCWAALSQEHVQDAQVETWARARRAGRVG